MDAADVMAKAFAMPLTSPSFPRGPYRYANREHLIITYRTDRAALEQAAPEPLEIDEPLVRCEFMRMESSTGFGRYSGTAQHIPVRLDGEKGAYTHNMFLDAHAPISGGRELWGFPQKLATPRLAVERDTLLGTLDYGPVRVATGTLGYKHRALADEAAMQILGEPGFLLKIIPHVDGTPRVCELVRYFRRDIVLKGAWTGPCALELHPHALAPLTDLPVLEVLSGVHLIADFTLALGEIVHDYLASLHFFRRSDAMKAEDVRRKAFSMPLHSPAYPPGPYRFIDREYLIITYRTDHAALEKVVPKPLEIIDPIVKYEFIRMPDSTGFGDYTESGQVIPVRFEGEMGGYVHAMFLDDDPPIAGGRELWGFPKKLASPTLRVEHDTLLGALDYGPVRVATGSMGYKHRAMENEPVLRALGEPGFLLKIIPHVDGTPRICELVRFRLGDIALKGAWTGPAALELHPHALAPLTDLPVLEVISGVHLIADLTLNLGEVVHDYLAP